jgi:hypothetical protein
MPSFSSDDATFSPCWTNEASSGRGAGPGLLGRPWCGFRRARSEAGIAQAKRRRTRGGARGNRAHAELTRLLPVQHVDSLDSTGQTALHRRRFLATQQPFEFSWTMTQILELGIPPDLRHLTWPVNGTRLRLPKRWLTQQSPACLQVEPEDFKPGDNVGGGTAPRHRGAHDSLPRRSALRSPTEGAGQSRPCHVKPSRRHFRLCDAPPNRRERLLTTARVPSRTASRGIPARASPTRRPSASPTVR